MNRKIWKALGIAVCMLALAAPRAMAELREYLVSNNEHFADAVGRINNESNIGDENEIVLMHDITLEGNYILTNGKTTTIKGEGKTITVNSGAGIKVTGEKTTLNLGANGYDKKLTIEGDTGVAFITVSGGATAYMYENVTLQNRQQVDQACVVLEENSVFNMHGGVIQNCKGKYGGVSLKNGSRFIMEGGTISGCSASEGGGLYATNQSTITISGGTISGCTAGGGGGLYAENNSTITISGGKIEDNEATRSGGGLLVKGSTLNIEGEGGTISGCKGTMGGGLYADRSTITIKGGTISGCTETSMGGGLYVIGSNLTIEGGTISECTAKSMGGGLYAENSTITISGGTIEKNEAAYSGGGLYAKDSSTITISGGTIEKNRAMYGGGVALNSSTINNPIKNWKVIGNEAYKLDSSIGGIGGGIYLTNGSMNVSAGSNKIYNNLADNRGADIFLDGNTSSIILPNAANMNAPYHNSGMKIDGWYKDDNPRYTPSESGNAVNVDGKDPLKGELSLVASYKAIRVRIEIDANGGVGGSGSQTVHKGTTVTLEAPTKEGHLFKGWKDGKGNSYPAGEDGKVKITVTGDMTLTAVWEARTFTVTYVLLDGKTRTETVTYGQNVTLGEEKREGHTFVGWKDGEKVYHAGETITVTEDKTLTAVWEARSFTVTYVLLNGKTRAETVDYGKTVTLVEEPRTGYTFVGWKDGEKMYHAGETITVTGDMTLTAEWKKLPSAENLPKTGDESPVLLWGAALAVSAAACFMLRRKK